MVLAIPGDVLVPKVIMMNSQFNVPEEINTLNTVLRNVTFIHVILRLMTILGVVIIVMSALKKMRYDAQKKKYRGY